MSGDLSYSMELAAERSCLESALQYSETLVRPSGLYANILNYQLKKLGLKGPHSIGIINSLVSLKHDPRNILDALIESGYKYYNGDEYFIINDNQLSSALDMLDVEGAPGKYLNVFRKLKEKLSYKTVDVSEQLLQVDKISKISRLKGDVCRAIDILAEVGYSLSTFKGKKMLLYEELDVFRDLAQVDADKFLKTFHKLKEKFKYKSIRRSSGEIDCILAISQISGYSNAIDSLAETGYKIKKIGLTSADIEEIKHTSDRLWKEALEDFTPCLYKNSPVEFIEYFKGLGVEDKKVVIKSIFNCNEIFNDHGVVTWLDENEPELIREVGLSLV